jgi:hypothetical protein
VKGLGRNRRCTTDQSWRWRIWSNMGVWGRSPADINPHLVSCRACRPDPAGTAVGWPPITMRWVWLLPPQVQVIMAVRSRARAALDRPVQRHPAGPCDTGYVLRTAQVARLFDLAVIGTVPRGT